MPNILVEVTIVNKSDFPIRWLDDGRPDGDWQDPWFPSNLKDLAPGQQGTFRQESEGAGVTGWVKFMIDIPPSLGETQTEYLKLDWNRPYLSVGGTAFTKDLYLTLKDPDSTDLPHPGEPRTTTQQAGPVNLENENSAIIADLLDSGLPFTGPAGGLFNEQWKHVGWGVAVLNAAASETLPLTASAASGVIYSVDPTVKIVPQQVTGKDDVARGGDLWWYRHLGITDGTVEWEGPKKVGNDWGGFRHVLSAGDGFIYAVDNAGDLWWFRHLGVTDGSVEWEGPKKVGNDWGGFRHVLSAGGGIIYAVDPTVKSVPQEVTGEDDVVRGGDLWWFRHLGQDDGTVRWEGPKKVGNDWGGFLHVVSAAGGIIYAVDPAGDLWWFRHFGQSDGTVSWEGPKKVGNDWADFLYVFSGGDGFIYAVDPAGDLWWFRHLGQADGTASWEGPKKVGNDWASFVQVFQ
jgi:hypothetical protein